MDIFDNKNNFIGSIPPSKGGFVKEYLKDLVFLKTVNKGYKYYPKYSHVYSISGNRANIISLFDIFLDNDANLKNEDYSKGLYQNLKKDFKLSEDDYKNALNLYFNPSSKESKKTLNKIYDDVFDVELRVNTRILQFDDNLKLPDTEIDCENEKNNPVCRWSQSTSRKKSESSSSVSSFDFEEEQDQEQDKPVLNIQHYQNFILQVVSYEIVEKNKTNIDINDLYQKTEPSGNLLSTGIMMGEESDFKHVESKDKIVKRYLKEFINSEHVNERKYLKPNILHFIYKLERGILRGEINENGMFKLKIKENDLYYDDLDKNTEYVNAVLNEIYNKFGITRVEGSTKVNNLNLKAIYKDGYSSLESVSNFYKGKIDRNTFVRFNMEE